MKHVLAAALSGLALLVGTVTLVSGHELRPGFLEILQKSPERYVIRFKVPARGNMRLKLYAGLPDQCTNVKPPQTERAGGGVLDRYAVACAGGLQGHKVVIDGLASTLTDVVARVALSNGSVQTARLTPDQPSFIVKGVAAWPDTLRTYLLLGVEHILLGLDHLLFVLALLLLISDRWMLVKTITAFTIAHSITLTAAAIGWADAPQAPVEAVVALSIMFAAAEVPRLQSQPSDLAGRAPWIIAFVFGLIHGFGFGGALKEIGLPQSDVPLALLAFNLGVEAGQLLFVVAVIALIASLERLLALRLPHVRVLTAYVIGSLAAFWFVQRVTAMS